jgi:hypothetical protein
MKASFSENIVRSSAKRESYAQRTCPKHYAFTLDSDFRRLTFCATANDELQSHFAVSFSTADMSGTKGSRMVWVKTDWPAG